MNKLALVIIVFLIASCAPASASPTPTSTVTLTPTSTPTKQIEVTSTPLIQGNNWIAVSTWDQIILLDSSGRVTSRINSRDIPTNLNWSPDGQNLTLSKWAQFGKSYRRSGLFNYRGGSPAGYREIVDLSIKVEQFTWSPDGKLLAYLKDVSGLNHLFIASPPDFNETQITDYKVEAFSWSPDSQFLVISAAPPGRHNKQLLTTYILNLEDMELVPLSNDLYNVAYLQWSSNGKYISVDGYSRSGNVYDSLSTLVYDASTFQIIREYNKYDDILWSPDGIHFALIGFRSLTIGNMSNANEVTVPMPEGETYWPISLHTDNAAWSPDGKYLTYVTRANPSSPYSLHATAVDGSETTTLLLKAALAEEHAVSDGFGWSADGRYIMFCKYLNEKFILYIADTENWIPKRFFAIKDTMPLNIVLQP